MPRLKAAYSVEEAKAAVDELIDKIEDIEWLIDDYRDLEIDARLTPTEQKVMHSIRMGYERERAWRSTLITRIERRIRWSIWRFTVVMYGAVVHHEYYSAIGQLWVEDKKTELEQKLINALGEFVAEWVGYSPVEWWFDLTERTQATGWQEIKPEYADYKDAEERLDTYYLAIEDKSGIVVHETEGDVGEL